MLNAVTAHSPRAVQPHHRVPFRAVNPPSPALVLRELGTTFDLGTMNPQEDHAMGGKVGFEFERGEVLFGLDRLDYVSLASGLMIPGELAERLAMLRLGTLENGVQGGMTHISLWFRDAHGRMSYLIVPRTPNGEDWSKARLSIMPMKVAELAQQALLGPFEGKQRLRNGQIAYHFREGVIRTQRNGAVVDGRYTHGSVSLGRAYQVRAGDRFLDIEAEVERQLRAAGVGSGFTHADLLHFFAQFNGLSDNPTLAPGTWLQIPTALEADYMATPVEP